MGHPETVSLAIAFSAGVFSFVSPCVLPLIPSYLSFITGLSFDEFTEKNRALVRRISLTHSLLFILGFSIVFIGLGASATLLGKVFFAYRKTIRIAGGILIIFFGIYITGFFRIQALEKERRIHFQERPLGYLGTVLIGSAFAAGWTPCIGPILGSILIYASTTGNVLSGVLLLSSYSLGLGIPFLISSIAFTSFLSTLSRIRHYLPAITTASGVLLITIGFLILTNYFSLLANYIDIILPG